MKSPVVWKKRIQVKIHLPFFREVRVLDHFILRLSPCQTANNGRLGEARANQTSCLTIHVYVPHGSPTINTLCNWISYTIARVETDGVKVAMEAFRPTLHIDESALRVL